MKITIQNISWNIASKTIIDSANLNIDPQRIVGIVGPNGSGKTSLLKVIYRVQNPTSGIILFNEKDILKLHLKETAKIFGVVTQEQTTNHRFTVKEIVTMGRYPHKSSITTYTDQDIQIAHNALIKTGLSDQANQEFHTLSGGEKQRTFIARAIAQSTNILILDEPTNHLDIKYQMGIMQLIKSFKQTTITTLHDLNIASRYCDYIYMMNHGKITYHGKPKDVLTTKNILDIYHVDVDILEKYDYPIIVYKKIAHL